MVACPSCNTPVQADASFCGQCGADLRSATATSSATEASQTPDSELKTQNVLAENEAASIPDLTTTDPTLEPEPIGSEAAGSEAAIGIPDLATTDPTLEPEPIGSTPETGSLPETEASTTPDVVPQHSPTSVPSAAPASSVNATQLQVISVRLRHAQTDTLIEIPRQLSVVRIGKPNDQTPPDIDVSGFPDSEVVSRVHANLRVEGDVYYIEDVGSSNGTYVNGLPLAAGNRHRLRPGDRIALGKGDKVSFVFESA